VPTPQITLRIPTAKRERWKEAAQKGDTNVSTVLRELMDAWAEEMLGPETET
jgi:predicted DNA-binding protein